MLSDLSTRYSTGQGNYTDEREALFKDLTADQLLMDIEGLPSDPDPQPSTA